ncbi:MAG: sulfite exporter TauE/SafE family protein [Vicinamibacterales bacterium]|nr:sulfite exporter TauE/SafE family protein [Vicinamibacterales bacterium]
MDLVADQWFLFPAAVVIATLGMSCGIGGAILFSPMFMVVLELPPAVAIGTALLTQLFGFSSGVYAYRRRQLIDYALARRLLVVAIPGAALGVLGAGLVPGDLLRRLFACGIVAIGVQLFRSYQRERREADVPQTPTGPPTLVDARGIAYRYTLRSPHLARLFAAGGGTLLGLVSVGLAELLEYHLIVISLVPPPVAVATSILVVFAATLTAAGGHLYTFAVHAAPGTLTQVGQVVMFTIPGVILGGQIGPWLQTRLNPTTVRLGMAFVFCALGVFMLLRG